MARFFIYKTVIFTIFFILPKDIFGGEVCKTRPSVPGPSVPALRNSFSENLQINKIVNSDKEAGSTIEVTVLNDLTEKSRSVEFWSDTAHMKYIFIDSTKSVLTIKYTDDEVTCTKSDSSQIDPVTMFRRDKAQPLDLITIVTKEMLEKTSSFRYTGQSQTNGILVDQWVFCDYIEELDAEVEITLSYTVLKWKPIYISFKETKRELVQIEIFGKKKSGDLIVYTLNLNNVKKFQPANENFQPPELVHCPGYQSDKKLPELPVYFSYRSEKIQYGSSAEVNPTISHRVVNYDTKSGIARLKFDSPDKKDSGISEETTFIFDYNLGILYSEDPLTGSCKIVVYDHIFDSFSAIKTSTNSMLDTKQFFALDGVSLSYNGKYEARGILCDVYSGVVTRNGDKREVFWYFATDRANIIEGQVIEKNVLIKLVSRPVSALGKQDQIELNFYDFVQEEPNIALFDISSCFSETESKSFLLSFIVNKNELIKESISSIKATIHQAIQKTARINRQRVVVNQVYFQEKYLYAQFTLLDLPPVRGQKPAPKEGNLTNAVKYFQDAIDKKEFTVTHLTNSEKEVTLIPEVDGLKEVFVRKSVKEPEITYNEGSVIGVSIGMTILGFLLGAVVINLIISRKFGVSLFQKSGFLGKGARGFGNPLNESSI